jgi:hypothetical protein
MRRVCLIKTREENIFFIYINIIYARVLSTKIDDATSITSPSRHPPPCSASSLESLCRGCRSQRVRRRSPVPRRWPARSIPRIRPSGRETNVDVG